MCGNHPTSKVLVGTVRILATTDVIGLLCLQFVYVCNLTDLWHSLPGSLPYKYLVFSYFSVCTKSKSPLDSNP